MLNSSVKYYSHTILYYHNSYTSKFNFGTSCVSVIMKIRLIFYI